MPYAVITRDAEGTAAYAPALRALDLEAVAMPVTGTVAMHDDVLRALESTRYDAIAVASKRAAPAITRWLQQQRDTLPVIWAVGAATAAAFTEHGIAVRVPPGAQNGETLANAIVDHHQQGVTGSRILVPRAEDGRDDIIEILTAAGAIVDAVTAYRTVATAAGDPSLARGRALLATNQAAVCAVFAPSQVHALDALVSVREIEVLFAAIGGTTATALREAAARNIVVAAEPTPEGLANAIAAVYPSRQ